MRTAQSWLHHVQAPLKKSIDRDKAKRDGPLIVAWEAHFLSAKTMYQYRVMDDCQVCRVAVRRFVKHPRFVRVLSEPRPKCLEEGLRIILVRIQIHS